MPFPRRCRASRRSAARRRSRVRCAWRASRSRDGRRTPAGAADRAARSAAAPPRDTWPGPRRRSWSRRSRRCRDRRRPAGRARAGRSTPEPAAGPSSRPLEVEPPRPSLEPVALSRRSRRAVADPRRDDRACELACREPADHAAAEALAVALTERERRCRRRPACTALAVRGLTKRFGDTLAVDGIDLTVPAGTFYGVVGPNGAGKTTTLSMIAGPAAARSRAASRCAAWTRRADPVAAKRLMGVLPDRLRTFDRLTGRQLLYYYGVLRGLAPRGRRVAHRRPRPRLRPHRRARPRRSRTTPRV